MDVDEPIMHRDHQKEGLDSCNRADYCTVSPYREKRWDEFKFPTKLHVVLDLAIEEKFEDILCWSPHGKAFRIHDKQKFGNQIMPKYFPGISKFKSFQRQLNLYGIRQRGIPLTTEFAEHGINRTRVEYSHPFFVQGQIQLTEKMTRPPSSGGNKRAMAKKIQKMEKQKTQPRQPSLNFRSSFSSSYQLGLMDHSANLNQRLVLDDVDEEKDRDRISVIADPNKLREDEEYTFHGRVSPPTKSTSKILEENTVFYSCTVRDIEDEIIATFQLPTLP